MGEEKKQVQLTEEQLIQIAQAEENELMNKKAIITKMAAILNETITTKETIQELKTAKGKLQIAIGATIIIEVNAENTKTCKRGFAENAYKEETMDETIEWLGKKEEQIKKQLAEVQKEAAASSTRLTNYVGILKQIESGKKKIRNSIPVSISK